MGDARIREGDGEMTPERLTEIRNILMGIPRPRVVREIAEELMAEVDRLNSGADGRGMTQERLADLTDFDLTREAPNA